MDEFTTAKVAAIKAAKTDDELAKIVNEIYNEGYDAGRWSWNN